MLLQANCSNFTMAVPATRMNLMFYKGKRDSAEKGHKLLKQKADALKSRFRDICAVIYNTKMGMGDSASTASFSLTQAEYAAGNFRSKVFEGNMVAQVRLNSRTDNVAGVKLPVFGFTESLTTSTDNLGLSGGGRKIQVCREKYGEYLKALIKLASLQTSFVAMDEALKVTNRRVNALENVTIPGIVGTISFIERELDELEREEFTRLKIVKKKKTAAIKAAKKEMELLAEAAKAVDISSVESKVSEPVVEQTPSKKKGGKKNKDKKPESALAGFDAADDVDVVFK